MNTHNGPQISSKQFAGDILRINLRNLPENRRKYHVIGAQVGPFSPHQNETGREKLAGWERSLGDDNILGGEHNFFRSFSDPIFKL